LSVLADAPLALPPLAEETGGSDSLGALPGATLALLAVVDAGLSLAEGTGLALDAALSVDVTVELPLAPKGLLFDMVSLLGGSFK
jgi:hypothetical protein